MAAPTNDAYLRRLRLSTIFLCIVGILLAIYAVHVKTSTELDPKYVAFCDLHEKISCTKVLGSRYGKGFGVLGGLFGENSIVNQPNSMYGVVFYAIHILLDARFDPLTAKLLLVAATAANFMSVYLAYLLAFVLHDVCVVCVATYVVNALLLVFNFQKLKRVQKMPTQKSKRAVDKKLN